jgi:hypothetical protein
MMGDTDAMKGAVFVMMEANALRIGSVRRTMDSACAWRAAIVT